MIQRYCKWGDHWVAAKLATEVYTPTRISGPEHPVWACWSHVDEHNLTTVAPPLEPLSTKRAFIGHRNTAPELPDVPA